MSKKTIENPGIQRMSISEQIFNVIKSNIASGNWKAGDRIPSETELANQFGVSRMSVRSALQRLTSLGLIESRVGEGTFVKQFSLKEYFKEATSLISASTTTAEINEFRLFFDNACMRLACERCKKEDIEELKTIYNDMEACAKQGDMEKFYHHDNRFHSRIVHIVNNSIYEMIYDMLQFLFKAHYEENLYMHMSIHPDSKKDYKDYMTELTNKHLNYIKALEARDPSILTDSLTDDILSFKQRSNLEE